MDIKLTMLKTKIIIDLINCETDYSELNKPETSLK